MQDLAKKIAEVRELRSKILPYKWEYEPRGQFVIGKEEGKYTRIADIRGWGHLTGQGALAMHTVAAEIVQDSTGKFISMAPQMAAIIEELLSVVKVQREALDWLIKARDRKIEFGKEDHDYQAIQPHAWLVARDALTLTQSLVDILGGE